MSATRTLAPGIAAMMTLCHHANAGPVVFQSADKPAALLELFTSEGCSSCPPAERWLSGLKDSPGLWKDFVPLAFHVDYWDHLGWRDPWSSKEFTKRQEAYARWWRNDSIYTPGFVLNGKEWRDWSRSKEPRAMGTVSGVLRVSSEDLKRWHVSFAPSSSSDASYEVHAALLVSELASDVRAGENQGRRLTHDFVVTSLTSGSLQRNADKAEGTLALDSSARQPGRRAVSIWVTRPGNLSPLQAVGGWLP